MVLMDFEVVQWALGAFWGFRTGLGGFWEIFGDDRQFGVVWGRLGRFGKVRKIIFFNGGSGLF